MTETKCVKCCTTCCTVVPPAVQMLLWLAVASAFTLIFCGIYIAKPALEVYTFKNTTCTPVRVEYRGIETCSCGVSSRGGGGGRGETTTYTFCSSTFPCYDIQVQYLAGDQNITSKIYSTQISLADPDKCSLDRSGYCSRSFSGNENAIRGRLRRHGDVSRARSYSCWYDPANVQNVIIRISERDTALTALVVPSVALVLFLLMAAFFYCGLKYCACCRRK